MVQSGLLRTMMELVLFLFLSKHVEVLQSALPTRHPDGSRTPVQETCRAECTSSQSVGVETHPSLAVQNRQNKQANQHPSQSPSSVETPTSRAPSPSSRRTSPRPPRSHGTLPATTPMLSVACTSTLLATTPTDAPARDLTVRHTLSWKMGLYDIGFGS
jgi:hypothetical protein